MKPKMIVVHHSACDDPPSLQWAAIRRYHVEQNGWKDIGYHAGVENIAGGFEALYGRPLDQPGAHAVGHNKASLGICFVGNFTAGPPAGEQLRAGARVIAQWLRIFDLPTEAVVRHGDLNATECPGAAFPFARLLTFVLDEQEAAR